MESDPKVYSGFVLWAIARYGSVPASKKDAFTSDVIGTFLVLGGALDDLPKKISFLSVWRYARAHKDPLLASRERIRAVKSRWGLEETAHVT